MAPKIKWAHEWVSVDFGNNRGLSASFGGEKSRGSVPESVFEAWSILCHDTEKRKSKLTGVTRVIIEAASKLPTFKDKVEYFVKHIDDIWPEWNKEPNKYTPGQKVKFQFGKRKPVIEGTVVSIKGTMVTCDFPDEKGLMGIPADLLDMYNA